MCGYARQRGRLSGLARGGRDWRGICRGGRATRDGRGICRGGRAASRLLERRRTRIQCGFDVLRPTSHVFPYCFMCALHMISHDSRALHTRFAEISRPLRGRFTPASRALRTCFTCASRALHARFVHISHTFRKIFAAASRPLRTDFALTSRRFTCYTYALVLKKCVTISLGGS